MCQDLRLDPIHTSFTACHWATDHFMCHTYTIYPKEVDIFTIKAASTVTC
jgi:hypothetical protein